MSGIEGGKDEGIAGKVVSVKRPLSVFRCLVTT